MRKGAAEEWFFSDARMVKEGRRIAATAFIRPKWSIANQPYGLCFFILCSLYVASDEGLRSLIHASLTKRCQSLYMISPAASA